MRLEAHVKYLDGLSLSLRTASLAKRSGRSGAARQYRIEFLVRALLLARRLHHQGQLASTLEQALHLLPEALKPLALACLREEVL
eukprot:4273920-Alexandrium_andersonii.AAC.1